MRAAKTLDVLLCFAALLGAIGCVQQPVKEGVSRVNKPAMRRGSALDTDITSFLRGGYMLLKAEGRFEATLLETSGEANKLGRGIGAHLIVVYTDLERSTIDAVIAPVFMAEPPFSAERFRAELAGLSEAPFTIFYWSRPDRPIPLGLFFHPTLPDATRAAVGEIPAVQIRGVIRSSPAAQGYLQNDDVVTHIDGEPVPNDAAAMVERLTPKRGQRVTFTVLRDGSARDAVVALYP